MKNPAASASTLLIAATAPVQELPDGGLRLDVKFTEGMRLHAAQWPGPVRCLLRRDGGPVPFGRDHAPGADLGFELVILDPGQPAPESLFKDVRALFAAADDMEALPLADLARARGAAVVWSIEYTLETRLAVAAMDPSRGWLRRQFSKRWNRRMEVPRCAAMAAGDGLQANGYPAFDSYAALSPSPMLYLDNRVSLDLMATPEEMALRSARQRRGAPLRLIHSGRLEPMKGAQDLLPVMAALRRMGVDVSLDIYGTGSLEAEIRRGLSGFAGRVRLHKPVDFESELVPISRGAADIFLSCHRQSDPSCSYLEAMGCGLAVAGYANAMWQRLSREAESGRIAPLGKPALLAIAIAQWDKDRDSLAEHAQKGHDFARQHAFEAEFTARMDHLKAVAGV